MTQEGSGSGDAFESESTMAGPGSRSTIDDRAQSYFEAATTEACRALFAGYGVELSPIDPMTLDQTEFLLCAVIGFSGRDVKGTMVLAATRGPIAATYPVTVGNDTRDWIGELANQLLGAVKRDVLRHDVEIFLNLPAVLGGKHIAPIPRHILNPICFAAAGGTVALWIEVEAGPRFDVVGGDGAPGPAAGETLLF